MCSNAKHPGTDHGLGQTNIDNDTGIRFGVIPANDVGQAWYDDSQVDFGPPSCPECGNQLEERDGAYPCEICDTEYVVDQVYGDEPQRHTYARDGYEAVQSGSDTDIVITKSPFYTRASFCSPCAPGAGDLSNPIPNGVKTYCFGHDWFEDGVAPYPVYRVDSNQEVLPDPIEITHQSARALVSDLGWRKIQIESAVWPSLCGGYVVYRSGSIYYKRPVPRGW